MLQNRLAITAGAIAFALLILGNFLVVRYEVKGSEEPGRAVESVPGMGS
jgi:hypothetical protein